MIEYSYRGIGVARADYTLDADALSCTLPGRQLGKRLTEGRIPLAAIRGFLVEDPPRARTQRARTAYALATAAGALGGTLVVSWQDGGRLRRRTYHMVNVADPAFRALVAELARRRPDADLRRLPVAEAKQQLGMWSDRKTTLVAIAGLVILVLVLGAIHSLTR
jgi:hypothetical protein